MIDSGPCGPCGACCNRLRIPARKFVGGVDKPANVWCEFYDKGCTIHEEKPVACKRYECYWLKLRDEGVLTTTEWRPNEVGFIVSVISGKEKVYVTVDEYREGALDEDHEFIRFMRERMKNNDLVFTFNRVNT